VKPSFDIQQLRDAVDMARMRGWDVSTMPTRMHPDFDRANSTVLTGYVAKDAHYLITYPLGKNSPARGVQEVSISQDGLERLLGLLVKEST
jgi:hypothetical protein